MGIRSIPNAQIRASLPSNQLLRSSTLRQVRNAEEAA